MARRQKRKAAAVASVELGDGSSCSQQFKYVPKFKATRPKFAKDLVEQEHAGPAYNLDIEKPFQEEPSLEKDATDNGLNPSLCEAAKTDLIAGTLASNRAAAASGPADEAHPDASPVRKETEHGLHLDDVSVEDEGSNTLDAGKSAIEWAELAADAVANAASDKHALTVANNGRASHNGDTSPAPGHECCEKMVPAPLHEVDTEKVYNADTEEVCNADTEEVYNAARQKCRSNSSGGDEDAPFVICGLSISIMPVDEEQTCANSCEEAVVASTSETRNMTTSRTPASQTSNNSISHESYNSEVETVAALCGADKPFPVHKTEPSSEHKMELSLGQLPHGNDVFSTSGEDTDVLEVNTTSTISLSAALQQQSRTGTEILRGLVDELSSLNRFIMCRKRELEASRHQRQAWLKLAKDERNRSGKLDKH